MKIIDTRPALFQPSENNIWTDPWIQEQLLQDHLNPASDAASRNAESIRRTVEFIDRQLKNGSRILDLGCGPGLYTRQLKQLGHRPVGIDFNARAIEYARRQKPEVDYLAGDYLRSFPAGEFDAILMIYCDMGTHSAQDRDLLLRNCFNALAPGGKLIFDLFDETLPTDKPEGRSWEYSAGPGFWADAPYLLLSQTFHYPAERTFAYQYNLIPGDEVRHFIIWERYYAAAEITRILTETGFRRVAIEKNLLSGNNFTSNRTMFIVAEK